MFHYLTPALPTGDPLWAESAIHGIRAWSFTGAGGVVDEHTVRLLIDTWKYREMLSGEQVEMIVRHFAGRATGGVTE